MHLQMIYQYFSILVIHCILAWGSICTLLYIFFNNNILFMTLKLCGCFYDKLSIPIDVFLFFFLDITWHTNRNIHLIVLKFFSEECKLLVVATHYLTVILNTQVNAVSSLVCSLIIREDMEFWFCLSIIISKMTVVAL